MECLICKSEEFIVWKTARAKIEEGKVNEIPIFPWNEEVQTIYCSRCGILYYEKSRGWLMDNYVDSNLYWDEEKQCLEIKATQRDTKRSVRKLDPFKGIPDNVLLEMIEEMKRENESETM